VPHSQNETHGGEPKERVGHAKDDLGETFKL
jgi:hypothetical protein